MGVGDPAAGGVAAADATVAGEGADEGENYLAAVGVASEDQGGARGGGEVGYGIRRVRQQDAGGIGRRVREAALGIDAGVVWVAHAAYHQLRTVAFEKGGVTYYRARFGGFGSKNAARNACGALKKKNIDCYAVQQ